jgi:hypothetical protein
MKDIETEFDGSRRVVPSHALPAPRRPWADRPHDRSQLISAISPTRRPMASRSSRRAPCRRFEVVISAFDHVGLSAGDRRPPALGLDLGLSRARRCRYRASATAPAVPARDARQEVGGRLGDDLRPRVRAGSVTWLEDISEPSRRIDAVELDGGWPPQPASEAGVGVQE